MSVDNVSNVSIVNLSRYTGDNVQYYLSLWGDKTNSSFRTYPQKSVIRELCIKESSKDGSIQVDQNLQNALQSLIEDHSSEAISKWTVNDVPVVRFHDTQKLMYPKIIVPRAVWKIDHKRFTQGRSRPDNRWKILVDQVPVNSIKDKRPIFGVKQERHDILTCYGMTFGALIVKWDAYSNTLVTAYVCKNSLQRYLGPRINKKFGRKSQDSDSWLGYEITNQSAMNYVNDREALASKLLSQAKTKASQSTSQPEKKKKVYKTNSKCPNCGGRGVNNCKCGMLPKLIAQQEEDN
jgi:hypothetical protein